MHVRYMNQSNRRPPNSNLPVKIIFSLYESKLPLSLSAISRSCRSPRQKVSYHLSTLLEGGLILYDEGEKKYRIQPCLRDLSLIEKLAPLVEAITGEIDSTQTSTPLSEIVFNVLEYYLHLHVVEEK
jgi:DNA-binding transcriptional ArsR family regulator